MLNKQIEKVIKDKGLLKQIPPFSNRVDNILKGDYYILEFGNQIRIDYAERDNWLGSYEQFRK